VILLNQSSENPHNKHRLWLARKEKKFLRIQVGRYRLWLARLLKRVSENTGMKTQALIGQAFAPGSIGNKTGSDWLGRRCRFQRILEVRYRLWLAKRLNQPSGKPLRKTQALIGQAGEASFSGNLVLKHRRCWTSLQRIHIVNTGSDWPGRRRRFLEIQVVRHRLWLVRQLKKRSSENSGSKTQALIGQTVEPIFWKSR
jgi:hypothetical protein